MWKAVVAVLLLAGLWPIPGLASAAEVVRLANGEWMPMHGESLPGYGAASRIVSEAFAQIGVQVEYGFFPWARSYRLALEGTWDGTLVWKSSPERQALFFVSEPVLVLDDALFSLRENPVEWNCRHTWNKMRIGTAIGYYYGEVFERAKAAGQVLDESARTDEVNLRKLLGGRLDAVIITRPVGEEMIRRLFSPEDAARFFVDSSPVLHDGYCVLFSRTSGAGERWCRLFNQGLAALKAGGGYRRILDDLERGLFCSPQQPFRQ